MPKQLPEPARKGLIAKLCSKVADAFVVERKSGEKIPDRVYIDNNGVEHPWVCDENPRMWLGQNEED